MSKNINYSKHDPSGTVMNGLTSVNINDDAIYMTVNSASVKITLNEWKTISKLVKLWSKS